MYPVSGAFLLAIKQNTRKYYWTGRITTTAGTVYEFDQEDMVKGSGYITSQCCGSTEMGISLFSEINRYTLEDALVELFYHLQLADGTYEEVPMGIFEVSEANRKAKCLEIKAYDYMVRFERNFNGFETVGNAYDFMVLCSNACKVELEQSRETIEAMPNGTEGLSIYSDNDIETYRDVLYYVGQVLGGFFVINRSGKLELRKYGNEPVLLVERKHGFSSSFSDFITRYTAVSSANLRTQIAEYYALDPDDGLTMNLGVNPLLQFGLDETRRQLCENILADLSVVNYVPFDSDTIGNPALDVGDILSFSGGQADSTKYACITSNNIKIGGRQTIKCVGKNPKLSQAKSKNDKNISGLLNQIEAGRIGIHTFTNASAFTVAETDTKIISIEFATTEDNHGSDVGDGRVGMYVEEKNRSWCSSSNANDQRAITIECASDTTEPYAFRDVVYKRLIELCIDICKRNGKNKLIWFGDKDKTLNYSPKSGEMILTVHRWFANKSCPGNWMYARMGDLAEKVTKALQGSSDSGGGSASKGTQASILKDLSEVDAIKKVGALFTADQKKSGILALVSLAQFILESGYGKSELAQNANNIFGMKCSLSGNTWAGSSWDGKSKYTKKTQEQNADGSYETITADFRKYPCIEDSIADHSAYLLGAMNGKKLRYDGLKGCTDYKKAVQIIKNGGYATSLTHVEKLCSIIEKWKLTDYDVKDSGGEVIRWYRVRKSWADSKTQKGAYKILDNAKKCADQNPGYKVFDADGKVVYQPKAAEPAVKVPFLVKVSISDLNIRKGPGTDYGRVQFCPIGVYTIMEVRAGQGSKAGWGRLKSGIGWISLDFVKRL